MSPLLGFLLFFLVIFTLLSLTRLMHLLNTLYDNRCRHAAISRGVDPSSRSLLSESRRAVSQWDSLAASPHSSRPRRTMIILGSGGHTAEMLCLLRDIDRHRCCPLMYVRAKTDISSEVRVRKLEMEKLNAHQCSYLVIPRSREVGQSYASSVFSTLYSIVHSLRVVFAARPELILCNGPGTCLPIIVAAWLYKLWLFRPCRIVFIESFCRVESLSLCGLLLYPLVDRLIVQWPQVADSWQLTEYCGRLM